MRDAQLLKKGSVMGCKGENTESVPKELVIHSIYVLYLHLHLRLHTFTCILLILHEAELNPIGPLQEFRVVIRDMSITF